MGAAENKSRPPNPVFDQKLWKASVFGKGVGVYSGVGFLYANGP